VKREWTGKVSLSTDLYEAGLSEWAQRSAASLGRERPEEPCTLRTPYQRDRDRIVHSKAFRRLKHKTQVFIAPEGDHYRTRLTHTLEGSGNEDLAEAIALGHDLGHTPFGHAGEGVIDEMLRDLGAGGFQHNEQSARVVEVLENDGWGLNLTWEVRDGIRHHSGDGHPATLEAQIVHLADRIAYVNHDIDDALRACLIVPRDLPQGPVAQLGETGSERIDALVHDVVDSSADAFAAARAGAARPVICQTPAIGAAMEELRSFLFATVYPRALERAGGEKVRQLITQLMEHFLENPQDLPSAAVVAGDAAADRLELLRAVTDHVAGMTDRYAQRVYLDLFMPKCWGNL
jgi:dGTPase